MYLSKLNLRSPIRSSVRKSNCAGTKSTNYQVKLQATFRAALFLLPFLFKMKGETQYPITSCVDNTCTKQCILLQISFHAYVKTPTSCVGPASPWQSQRERRTSDILSFHPLFLLRLNIQVPKTTVCVQTTTESM